MLFPLLRIGCKFPFFLTFIHGSSFFNIMYHSAAFAFPALRSLSYMMAEIMIERVRS